MKTHDFVALASVCLVLLPAVLHAQGEEISTERRAQTGMKFLTVPVNPRATALGEAVVGRSMQSAALLYNPSGMALMDRAFNLSLSNVEWAGDFRYNAGTFAYRPADGLYGVFGLSVVAASYGNFIETIRADNTQGYRRLGTFSPSALSVGLGYARTITDRFSVGAHVKYAGQSLGRSTMRLSGGEPVREKNDVSTVAADFGFRYGTGFRSLVFAGAIRNFSQELTYAEESFELPLTFQIGLSMDMTDISSAGSELHAVYLSIDAAQPRDFNEHFKFGAEYVFDDLFAVRAGYRYPNDEQGISAGAGVRAPVGGLQLGADYTYMDFGILDRVHNLGMTISF